ncbi:MAG: MFS transporter [Rhodothermales bacterium]|nr:MFS transporter [Rhodothermales bacterium]
MTQDQRAERARKRSLWSWAFYDFANSSFTTLVVTFIYSSYFQLQIAASENEGTTQSSWAVSISAIAVAVLSPYVGSIADRGGLRKRFLVATSLIAILGSFVLFFPTKGDVFFALSVFVIANVSFELSGVFYNAYLPEIAKPSEIGRLSGYGWGLGYVGGLACLIIALFTMVQPDVPWFGLSKVDGENIRATNLLVGFWFTLFALPMFLWVREKKRPAKIQLAGIFKQANQEIKDTFRHIRQYRQVFRMLLARLVYNDGLVTIFSLGGLYATNTFDFSFEEVIQFGIALNVAAGLGAVAFGFLDDRIGGKKTILITLVGLVAATVLAVSATAKSGLWIAGIVVGLLAGANQSASRSLLGRFVPPDKENEFYGFFAFSGKATAFLGPFLFGLLTQQLGSQRYGVAVVAVFFFVGALLLFRVDEAEGRASSGRTTA